MYKLGYVISIVFLGLSFVPNLDEMMKIICVLLFAVSFAVSHVAVVHQKNWPNKTYRVMMTDERESLIRDKVNSALTVMLLFSLGIQTVVFIALDFMLPAMLTAILLLIVPLLAIGLNRYYQKKL